jgi:hypothetical protein
MSSTKQENTSALRCTDEMTAVTIFSSEQCTSCSGSLKKIYGHTTLNTPDLVWKFKKKKNLNFCHYHEWENDVF